MTSLQALVTGLLVGTLSHSGSTSSSSWTTRAACVRVRVEVSNG